MTEKIVELIRRFAPISSRSPEWDFLMPGLGAPQRWYEIEDDFRVLIIADPGAGKTFEAQARAQKIKARAPSIQAGTATPRSSCSGLLDYRKTRLHCSPAIMASAMFPILSTQSSAPTCLASRSGLSTSRP